MYAPALYNTPAIANIDTSASTDIIQLATLDLKIYIISGLLFVTLALAIFVLWRFKRYQKFIQDSQHKLSLSLWATDGEMWDWRISESVLIRTNIKGTYEVPHVDKGSFPPNKKYIHPNDKEKVTSALMAHFHEKTAAFECIYRVKKQNGTWTWVLDKGKIVERDEHGQPVRMTGVFKDIQQLKNAEDEFNIFTRSIESISEGVIILDPKLEVVHVNPGYLSITGYETKELVGRKLRFDSLDVSLINEVKTTVDRTGNWKGDISAQTKSGQPLLAYVTASCIRNDDGEISYYVAILSDTTKRKAAEAKLVQLAKFDTLTGLPNRNVFFSNLQKNVNKKLPTAVLVFDLDNFKKINDSLGHQAGDNLLQSITKRMESVTNETSSLYRLGGDEFALIMDNTNDIHKVTQTAKDILTKLSTPYSVNQHELVIAGSIGIVLYPEDGKQPETLLRNADTAMYHAKDEGNSYLFFNEDMNKEAVKRLQVENLIRLGMKEDYFQVFYQPKMCLRTGQLKGMEALVRFIAPTKGTVNPGTFISIAEETGQIIEIGDIVLRKSCQQMKYWIDEGLLNGRVAVNLSARQFSLPNLPSRISRILLETGLSPHNLELEITEGTVMDHPKEAIETMHQLRELGIHLAMDDFGTGYSSLSYLSKFPLNTLKIDKAFVDDTHSDIGKAMVDTILTIATNLSLSTVAEGVENVQQRTYIQSMGCDVLQGYLYSKPLSPSEFQEFAKQNKNRLASA